MAKELIDEQDALAQERPLAVDSQDFAATLTELEALVGQLESGDLTLEQSLGAFERGIRLTRDAQQRLDRAELRVRALLEQADGHLDEAPFETNDANGANVESSGRGSIR